MSRLLFLGIPLLFHAYVGWRLVPPLLGWPWVWGAIVVALAGSALLLPVSFAARGIASRRLADMLTWVGMLLLGLFSSLLVLTLARDALLAPVALVHLVWPRFVSWSAVATDSAAFVPAAALWITVFGFVSARRTAAVVRVDVPIANLPPALDGFSIAQITDIHVGPTIKRAYVQGIVDAVNGLHADLVAITGDLVDGKVDDLRDDVAPIARLASRHGSFFVTGNHEYYSGAPAWVAELRRIGVRVLMNEHAAIEHAGATLVVAGVADYSAHHFDPRQRSDPAAALANAPENASVKILLAHQPRTIAAAAEAGFDLQLSGHTHGGQFLPWNYFVRLQQPFTAGLHRWGQTWIYTSTGTGYWGPPKRFGVRSEITLLRLVRR